MSNSIFKLFGEIGLKVNEAENGLKKIRDDSDSTINKIESGFKKAAVVIGSVFAVGKIIDFGKTAAEAAATAQAMESQFEQVFGTLDTEAQAALDRVAENMGALPNRLKPAFNQIASFAKVNGMETAESIEFSERAMQAAADTAAFYDKSIEDTTDTLQSYLKGNFQVADNLGILSTETTRNTKATEMFGKKYSELDGIQAQGVLLSMYEEANDLSGAMGQAAREADGWENVMGNLSESWNQFLVVVGGPILKAVIPIIQGITSGVVWLAEAIKPLMTGMSKWFDSIGKALKGPLKNVQKWFSETGDDIKEFFVSAFSELSEVLDLIDWESLLDTVSDVVAGIIDFFKPLANSIKTHLDIVLTYFNGLWDAVKKAMNGDWSGAFETLKQTFVTAFTSIGDNLLTTFGAMFDNIKSLITSIDWTSVGQTVMTFLGTAIRTAINLIGDIGAEIKTWIQEKLGLDGDTGWAEIGKTIIDKIGTAVSNALSTAVNWVSDIATWISDNAKLVDWSAVGQAILDGIYGAVSTLASWGADIVGKIVSMITDGFDGEGVDWAATAKSILNGILTAVGFLTDIFKTIAIAIISGIAKSIADDDGPFSEIATNIVEAIEDFVNGKTMSIDWKKVLGVPDWAYWWMTGGAFNPNNWSTEQDPNYNPNGDGSGNGSTASGMSNVLNPGGSGHQIELNPDSSKSATLVSQYDTMATEATTGMNKVNVAIRAGYEAIRTTFTQMESNMVRLMTQIMTKLPEPVPAGMRAVNQSFRAGYEAIRVTFSQMSGGLTKLAQQIVNDVVAKFSESTSRFNSIGADYGRGIYNGLASQQSRIAGLARTIANNIDSTIRRALDINSPSALAEETTGFYGEGLVNGLINSIASIKKASLNMVDAMVVEPPAYTFDMVKNLKYQDLAFSQNESNQSESNLLTNNLLLLVEEMANTMKSLNDKDSNFYFDGHVLGKQGTQYINKQNNIMESRKNSTRGVR